ncbi:MAG TPA: DNA polymerase III subunit chi [Pseudomonadales bacterium]
MTEVSFYILDGASADDRLRFACRLAAQSWRRHLPVFLFSPEAQAAELDTLLWEFRDASFVPHRRSDDQSLPASPVEIGQNDSPAHHHGLLINLGDHIPDWFSRFDRTAEITCNTPELLEALRERYRFYESRGYPLQTHRLDQATSTR